MSQSSRDIEVFSLAASATNLWRVIESYGMDPEGMFRAAGSDFAPPSAAGSKLPFFLVDRIRAHAAELSGDEAFGLRAARFFHPSQLESLGFAWLASYSLRDGFARLARFAKVVNTRASLHVSDTADGLSVEPYGTGSRAGHHLKKPGRQEWSPGLPGYGQLPSGFPTVPQPRNRDCAE